MGNSLSPRHRHSSSKRRTNAFACLPTPSSTLARQLGSARDTCTTSVSTANSAASDESAADKARRQKVASASSSSSRRCLVAASQPRADHAHAHTHAHPLGASQAMVAGSMPPSSASASAARLPTDGTTSVTESKTDTSEQRIRRAERVLKEIADEYTAKRAAGLVPTKPVPARTLLWEELAQQQQPRAGKRGQCIFGRDSGAVCGCTTYSKMDLPTNSGGICECCGHGAPWHRLTGGSMWSATASSSMRFHSRSHGANASLLSSGRGVARRSRVGSSARSRQLGELLNSSARSRVAMNEHGEVTAEYYDEYGYDDYDDYDDDDDDDYDSDYYDDDDDDDDEDIANEVARPYGAGPFDSTPPLIRPPGLDNFNDITVGSPAHRRVRADSGSSTTSSNYMDRSSLVSNSSNLGLPPRLSSTSRHLDRLLGAIAKYRAIGLSEDEIEVRIREDFPPTERMSSAPLSPRFAPE